MFRTQEVLDEGIAKVDAHCASACRRVALRDHSKVFNTARIEALELENLMDVALATVALGRGAPGEPRRAFARWTIPQRDDYPVAQAHALQSRRAASWTTSRCA